MSRKTIPPATRDTSRENGERSPEFRPEQEAELVAAIPGILEDSTRHVLEHRPTLLDDPSVSPEIREHRRQLLDSLEPGQGLPLFPQLSIGGERVCAWCKGNMKGKRKDAKTCGKACRQALSRFRKQIKTAKQAGHPIKLAYADPPYPGKAGYYADHPDYRGEVDHGQLLDSLAAGYDGWALSTSSEALPAILALCVRKGIEVRVAAWFRGQRNNASAWPLQSWEPVIYAGGRRVVSREQVADSLEHWARPRTSDPQRVIGAKPASFCSWMFQLLGARKGDTLTDLYPGSGGVSLAWKLFQEAA